MSVRLVFKQEWRIPAVAGITGGFWRGWKLGSGFFIREG